VVPSLVEIERRGGGEGVVSVERWAELRREHFVGGKSIKELARATGLSRNTIRRALRSDRPPGYRRPPKAGVLEPFKPDIHRMLKDDPKLPDVRVRELLDPLGCTAGKTVVDDYLREVRRAHGHHSKRGVRRTTPPIITNFHPSRVGTPAQGN
jgi:transposase